jgi:superfamily II DNA or RNA helicase
LREALLREHYRGGQSFYVVPRISDLGHAMEFLKETVPEIKAASAHGQIGAAQLEETMTAFYDGKIDVLISTNIVESGLDIPTANTLVVHRADMFGLAQLYQLRGRIGRSKQRAYAYLTTPADRKMTEGAQRRLQVLQSLDQLAPVFRSPVMIWTFAARAICWAKNSLDMCAKSGSNFIRTCWKRRWPHYGQGRVAKSPMRGRRRSISAPPY